VNFFNFTKDYSAEWYTHNRDGPLKIVVTLRVKNIDFKNWGTSGADGAWVGIGFGGRDMNKVDVVMCEFHFRGTTANDVFLCFDKYASGFGSPTTDTRQDVNDVATEKSYYISNDQTTKTATLTAVFDRLLDTKDTTQDYILRDGDRVEAIWAYGPVEFNNPSSHGFNTARRGSFQMQMYSIDGGFLSYTVSIVMLSFAIVGTYMF